MLMKQERYDAAKRLLQTTMNIKEICDALDMKESTIRIIQQSSTKAECDVMMLENTRRHAKGIKANVEKEAPSCENRVILVANAYLAEELKKQTDLLTQISNKLAKIMIDLYGSEEEEMPRAK